MSHPVPLLAVATLCFVLAACGGDDDGSSEAPAAAQTSAPEQTEPTQQTQQTEQPQQVPEQEEPGALTPAQQAARAIQLTDIVRDGHGSTEPIVEAIGLVALTRLTTLCNSRELHDDLRPGCDSALAAADSPFIASPNGYDAALESLYAVVPRRRAISINQEEGFDLDLVVFQGMDPGLGAALATVRLTILRNPRALTTAVAAAADFQDAIDMCDFEAAFEDPTGDDLVLAVSCLALFDLLELMTDYVGADSDVGRERASERVIEALDDLGDP